MRDEIMAMIGMALGNPPSAVTFLSLCYLTVRWRRSLSKFPLAVGFSGEKTMWHQERALDKESVSPWNSCSVPS